MQLLQIVLKCSPHPCFHFFSRCPEPGTHSLQILDAGTEESLAISEVEFKYCGLGTF